MKRKCHSEKPKQFAEPHNSGALERTMNGVVLKNAQKSKQWALQVLTLSASERITNATNLDARNVLGTF